MTNEPVCETETDVQAQRADAWLPRRGERRGGMGWEAGIRSCKLLEREWISTALLYSAGNQSQYPVINYTGKEYEKQYIYYIDTYYMYILHSTLLCYAMLSHFSRVRLCATPQTAAHQAPPSLGFSRQEYWSGLPFPSPMHESESEVAQSCPTLSDPMDCSLPGSSVHGIFQARILEWGAIAFSNIAHYIYVN